MSREWIDRHRAPSAPGDASRLAGAGGPAGRPDRVAHRARETPPGGRGARLALDAKEHGTGALVVVTGRPSRDRGGRGAKILASRRPEGAPEACIFLDVFLSPQNGNAESS
jgi:hypothetical protein